MMDAAEESREAKIERLERELRDANAERIKYANSFEVLREMIFGSKQRIDIAVGILERVGLPGYDSRGGYAQPHDAGF